MKKILIGMGLFILFALFFNGFIYCLTAFLVWEPIPGNWSGETVKIVAPFMALITFACIVGAVFAALELDWENNKNK